MIYTINTYIGKAERTKVETINIRYLIELAEEFGLSCIENKDSLTVVGWKQLLIFKKQEDTQCRLIEIY